MKRIVFIFFLGLLLTGCLDNDQAPSAKEDTPREDVKTNTVINRAASSDTTPIKLTSYAERAGLTLDAPLQDPLEVNTGFTLSGKLKDLPKMDSTVYIWVKVIPKAIIDDLDDENFHYYIPVKNGEFSAHVNVHHGAGDYQVSILIPSSKKEEADQYYDGAKFTVINKDQDIGRDILYHELAFVNELTISTPQKGMITSDDGTFTLKGQVGNPSPGEELIVEMYKGEAAEMVAVPLDEGNFEEEIPLYLGEGRHHIKLFTLYKDDDTYYETASFYVDNQSDTEFAQFRESDIYSASGVMLEEPTRQKEFRINEVIYPISGKINPKAPLAQDVDYVIATVVSLDEEVEANYLLPVENGQFSGKAYFRFGPGAYEVILSIPDTEKEDDPSAYHYQPIAQLIHTVVDVPDHRDLLPSWGIQSEDPAIIQLAEELTTGKKDDRAKAKAIYRFVAQHIVYDVKKAEQNTHKAEDSALSALESGTGVCQDYAYLATALLRAANIKSHYVAGEAGERHAWVEAFVDGEWIEMDPTWGAGYVKNHTFHPAYTEVYFDPDPELLAETHTRTDIIY